MRTCVFCKVFAQPVFKILEDWIKQKFGRAADKLIAVRLIIRSSSVIITAGVAMLLPFFSDLMGLIGAIAFTPITFVLPSLFWLKVGLSLLSIELLQLRSAQFVLSTSCDLSVCQLCIWNPCWELLLCCSPLYLV